MLVFFAGNAVYFPLVEEKGLARRFGSYTVNTSCTFHAGCRDEGPGNSREKDSVTVGFR
jgi:hypothetical protein